MSETSKTNATRPIFWITILTLGATIFMFTYEIYYGQLLFPSDKLGQFGDFYGGVVATIASICAGVYLYFTYKNSKKDSDFQIINRLFDNIVHDINSLQFRVQYDKKKEGDADDKEFTELNADKQKFYTGIDAIYNFNAFQHTNPNSVMDHLSSILNSFENLIYMADKKVLYKHGDMKEITLKRIYYLFYSQILWPVWSLEEPHKNRPHREPGILTAFKNGMHDDSKYTVRKYAALSIKTIKFLSDRNLIEKKPEKIERLTKLME